MSDDDLRRCPFCGGRGTRKPYSETLTSMQRIQCDTCHIATPYFSTYHGGDPAEAWQARQPTPLPQEIDHGSE